jgi:hypothetical protein
MMGWAYNWDRGVGKSLGKFPLKDRRRYYDLKIDLRETGVRVGGGWNRRRIVPNAITV